MNDLITVVLPTYNGEKYLQESIDSVLAQTYENWELIIINDASTDSTLDIAKEYASKDKRITIISNESNQKLPKSLNIGFANAKGKYYTWTSDDNAYKPQAFEKMLQALKQDSSADMVHCDVTLLYENGKTKSFKVNSDIKQLLSNDNLIGACFLYTKEIALKVGLYDENAFLVEDYDYWLRIALNGRIIHLRENLYLYRFHKDSLTSAKGISVKNKALRLKEHYFKMFLSKFPQDELLKNAYDEFCLNVQIDTLLNFPKNEAIKLYKQINAKLPKKVAYKHYRSKYKQTQNLIYLDAMSELGLPYNLKAFIYKIKFNSKIKANEKIYKKSKSYINQVLKAKQWIFDNTLKDNEKCGIIVSSDQRIIYPEVTGYYIPTLIKWGEKELAKSYADYLLTIQNEDGSWNEPSGQFKYTFDTGQILKGLWEFVDSDEKYKKAFLKGCDYIIAQQRDDGTIATDNYDLWGLHYGKVVPEAIHLYCLEPLKNASKKFNMSKYEACVQKALDFYLSDKSLTDFNTLSHFNAYIIEALIDLGEKQRAQSAMDKIATYQRKDGFIPAYSHKPSYTCSTGLFQYAICWAKLGGEENLKKADKSFFYALSLQNSSGGWFGSYGKKALYFSSAEISWAVKYFLDALYFIPLSKLEDVTQHRMAYIDDSDGRYLLFKDFASNAKKILDVGCGKGRYERNLDENLVKNKEFFGTDISPSVLEFVPKFMQTKQGTLLNIPYDNEQFDLVFCSEALGFAIDVARAIEQLYRVTKKGGKILVIDKTEIFIRRYQVVYFEQYYNFKASLEKLGLKVQIIENIPYEDKNDGLFVAWVAIKP